MSGSLSWLPRKVNWRRADTFTLVATGAGLAACGGASELLTGQGQWPAYLAAVLLLGGGLSHAWRQGDRPWRGLSTVLRADGSWAARERVLAPMLMLVLLVTAVIGGSLLSLVVLALAVGLLYAQSQMLPAAEGAAAGKGKQIAGLILANGLAGGAGALVVMDALLDSGSVPQAVRLAIVLIVVRWPIWGAYRDTLLSAAPTEADRAPVRQFNSQFLAFGLAAPIVVLTVAVLSPALGGLIAAIGGLLAVAGGWLLKTTLLDRDAFAPGAAAAKPKQEEIKA